MCFSASASFTVSSLLAFAALLAQIKARSRAMQIFGLIPFIFAVQQAAEGFLWYLDPTSIWYKPMAYIFMIGASQWPLFIPFSMWFAEKQTERKKILRILMILGTLFFFSCLFYLFHYGIVARASGDHVMYRFNNISDDSYSWVRFVYVALVALAPFVSTIKLMWIFGLGVIGSFAAAYIWYASHYTSIWCFFAAVLSSLVLYIVLSE